MTPVIPAWMTPEVLSALQPNLWAHRLRQTCLLDAGPDSVAAFFLFDLDGSVPVRGPEVSTVDMTHLIGFVPFRDDGGSPFTFRPECHLGRVMAGGRRLSVWGVIGRDWGLMDGFIRGVFARSDFGREVGVIRVRAIEGAS